MRMLRLGIGAGALAVLAACGSSSSSGGYSAPARAPSSSALSTAPATGSSQITISNFAFSPANLTVHVGQRVTVTNKDSTPHTWTANDHSFDSGNLNTDASFSFTFTKAGTFGYICSIHPFMTGTVTVTK